MAPRVKESNGPKATKRYRHKKADSPLSLALLQISH